MAMLRTSITFAVAALLLMKLAMAANYTVGAPNVGWDTSTDLATWASSQQFLVGDNLLFLYANNHDVLEVTQAAYVSCQTSSPVQSHTGGTTVIPLSSPGQRYFICGTSGHCGQGMKVEIDTLATSTPPPASPPVSSPQPSKTPAPSPARSPKTPPTLSPSVPPTSSSDSPTTSTSPSGSPSTPTPPSSSANGNNFRTTLITMGFSLAIIMMVLAR